MYNPISIAPLTESQISKALKGLPVRVSSGNQHDIEISKEQLKKFAKAQKLGKAMNLTFDPFQIQKHMKLIGSGVNRLKKAQRWEGFANATVRDGIDTAGKATRVYYDSMNPLAQMGMGVSRTKKYNNWVDTLGARDLIDAGMSRGASSISGMGVSRTKKYNNWVDTLGARDLINAGMSRGASTISGFGLKKRGRPRKTGGALYVAGS